MCPVGQQRRPGHQPVTAEKSRQNWNKEINVMIMKCYFQSKPTDENGVPIRGYRQRMYKAWQKKGIFLSTEQRITDQARAIRKNGWSTDIELEGRKRRVLNEERQEREEMPERQDQDDVNKEAGNTEEPCVNESAHM